MKRRVPRHIRKILYETRQALQHIYADRLKQIVLFGSYARGDFSENSDIDLLLLLDGMEKVAAERAKYLPTICHFSLKYDVVISAIPYDVKSFSTTHTPLTLNISKEGVAL